MKAKVILEDGREFDAEVDIPAAPERALEQWVPKEGDTVYFVNASGPVSRTWDGDSIDHQALQNGLVFETYQEAEDWTLYQRAMAELKGISDLEMDPERKEGRYVVAVSGISEDLSAYPFQHLQVQPSFMPLFESEFQANAAIAAHAEAFKIVFGVKS